MDHTTLLMTQLTDIFRVGLLAGLVYTTERTRAQTGIVLPLVAGILFVAIIIASTMPLANVTTVNAVLSGLVANSIIIAVLWVIWLAFKKRS
jgi:hypothetical protein